MSSQPAGVFDRPTIIVADEDPAMVAFVVDALRPEGYAIFPAYDAFSAIQLATHIPQVALLISNTRVQGVPGIDLMHVMRARMALLPIIYIANIGRSTPELEARLPSDVPIMREPFSADELRAVVSRLLGRDGKRALGSSAQAVSEPG